MDKLRRIVLNYDRGIIQEETFLFQLAGGVIAGDFTKEQVYTEAGELTGDFRSRFENIVLKNQVPQAG